MRRPERKALLKDLGALEQVLDTGRIEGGVRRIGSEQEMFLVDSQFRPAPTAVESIERVKEPRSTTEIACFNLESFFGRFGGWRVFSHELE